MIPDFWTPDFEVRIDGVPLATAVERRITELSVVTEPGTMDTFRLVLANPLPELPFTHGPLADTFRAGSAIEIRMGYVDRLTKLFAGEVTSIACAFPESGLATITVSGHSRLHHLRGTPHTRTFLDMDDRAIAQKVLDELPSGGKRLTLDADPTPGPYPYVIQYNQTDLAFLLDRAGLIGFTLWVDDTTLKLQQATGDEAAQHTLVWGHPAKGAIGGRHLPLRSFTPTMNALQPVSRVTVQGYDQQKAERFEATVPDAPGGGRATTGADVAAAAGRRVEQVIVDQPIQSQDEARRLARAVFDRAGLEFITGTGSTIGVPELRAGRHVNLDGLGKVFDGEYSVTESTHTISSAGYLTTFVAKKAAVG